jgi:hypothetical protein
MKADALLEGAYDIHVHALPDVIQGHGCHADCQGSR